MIPLPSQPKIVEKKDNFVIFEIDGLPEASAREALRLGAHKLPIKTRIIAR